MRLSLFLVLLCLSPGFAAPPEDSPKDCPRLLVFSIHESDTLALDVLTGIPLLSQRVELSDDLTDRTFSAAPGWKEAWNEFNDMEFRVVRENSTELLPVPAEIRARYLRFLTGAPVAPHFNSFLFSELIADQQLSWTFRPVSPNEDLDDQLTPGDLVHVAEPMLHDRERFNPPVTVKYSAVYLGQGRFLSYPNEQAPAAVSSLQAMMDAYKGSLVFKNIPNRSSATTNDLDTVDPGSFDQRSRFLKEMLDGSYRLAATPKKLVFIAFYPGTEGKPRLTRHLVVSDSLQILQPDARTGRYPIDEIDDIQFAFFHGLEFSTEKLLDARFVPLEVPPEIRKRFVRFLRNGPPPEVPDFSSLHFAAYLRGKRRAIHPRNWNLQNWYINLQPGDVLVEGREKVLQQAYLHLGPGFFLTYGRQGSILIRGHESFGRHNEGIHRYLAIPK